MHRVLPIASAGLAAALGRVLDGGGPPVLPLPDDPAAAARLVALTDAAGVIPHALAAIVATSGSTGEPKGVLLTRAAILASAAATQDRLGGPGTWHTALPTHYVAGLMVLARAHTAGAAAVRVRPDLADLAPLPGRNYLSIVPTQLHRALADPALLDRLSGFDGVLVGGAAAADAEVAQAQAAGVRVVRTYGMSETSGGCVYDGVPLGGVRVELADDGRITLDTPTAFAGYLGRPDLTAAVLDGTRVRTEDRGEWVERRLRVLGRLDEVVVSGGVNVDLAAVERAAQALLPGTRLAAVGVPDAEWGTRVVLVVDGAPPSDLRERLAERLERAAVPEVRAGSLPVGASGKIDRKTLQRGLRR